MTCWVEKQGLDALILLTGVTRRGVTCWVERQGVEAALRDGCGPGSTLPESMLLPLPVLKCGCVMAAGGVGRMISTELWGNLSPRGLVLGLAGAGRGCPWEEGYQLLVAPHGPFFMKTLRLQCTSVWLCSLLAVVRQ